MSRFKKKWSKFDWPNHLWMVRDQSADRVYTFFGSWIAQCRLRFHGVKHVGHGLRVKGRIHLFTRRKDSIIIGKNVLFVSRFRSNPVGIMNPCVFDTLMGGKIQIGDHVGLTGVVLSSSSLIQIGNYTMLGANVRVFDHNYHSLDSETRRNAIMDSQNVKTAPVVIGSDVFVGTNAMILKGVTIGDRAVVGAGSVVTADVPDDEVWAGNPARCVRRAGSHSSSNT